MKISLLSVLCSIIFVAGTYGQDISVSAYYLLGEKSKDSHSTEETFAVSNSSVAYTVKYSGKKGKNQVDTEKTCTFTDQDLTNLRKTIETKELNVSDSLFSEHFKSKSFEVYTNISLNIVMDGQDYRVRINGDTIEFDDSKLYKNTVFFLTMLRKMIEGCK
ncbi:MAG: hypothetical protein IAE90_03470 [Ignavibacteria bacterium]|nr:hypothetical protein [Ignavibacteria bacterium]